ncbi:DUF1963 domain-containing protein [Actinomadura parmotrematis]|uniref:DUF1963 domain-containing protein n=1 Tax=Actinomadura parmotrematis TaxID=2864039 RepID=A0ABS7FRR1_9ACTN|nr:YwqG family protein [Actinomadura parmotrematis]MBW8483093.1 DUF1963 domain-containing protein [Actinomadura parmotrematis]
MADIFEAERARLMALHAGRVDPEHDRLVAELVVPALRLELGGEGRTRLGGPALLDPGTPWPYLGALPLNLVAVVDLAELPEVPGLEVPREGLLNFFDYNPDVPYERYRENEDEVPWNARTGHVVAASPARAVETAAPDEAVTFLPEPVAFTPIVNVPGPWDDVTAPLRALDPDLDWVFGAVTAWEDDYPSTGPTHQIGGYGRPVHNAPADDAIREWKGRDPESPEASTPAAGWRCLLQLSSDGRPTTPDGRRLWQWGDFGDVYYMITRAALAAGDYGRAVQICQQ